MNNILKSRKKKIRNDLIPQNGKFFAIVFMIFPCKKISNIS